MFFSSSFFSVFMWQETPHNFLRITSPSPFISIFPRIYDEEITITIIMIITLHLTPRYVSSKTWVGVGGSNVLTPTEAHHCYLSSQVCPVSHLPVRSVAAYVGSAPPSCVSRSPLLPSAPPASPDDHKPQVVMATIYTRHSAKKAESPEELPIFTNDHRLSWQPHTQGNVLPGMQNLRKNCPFSPVTTGNDSNNMHEACCHTPSNEQNLLKNCFSIYWRPQNVRHAMTNIFVFNRQKTNCNSVRPFFLNPKFKDCLLQIIHPSERWRTRYWVKVGQKVTSLTGAVKTHKLSKTSVQRLVSHPLSRPWKWQNICPKTFKDPSSPQD